jgi:acyl carrier protein
MYLTTFGGAFMFDKVKQILIDELQLDESEITLEAELTKDLGINSIELADLIMMCEEQFGVEISEDDANEFVTVGDVVNYLEKL